MIGPLLLQRLRSIYHTYLAADNFLQRESWTAQIAATTRPVDAAIITPATPPPAVKIWPATGGPATEPSRQIDTDAPMPVPWISVGYIAGACG